MIELRKFEPRDLDEIEVQPAQTSWREYGSPEYAALLARGFAYTLRDQGQILACAGVLQAERDVGHLWAFLSIHARTRLVRLTRMALRLCEVSGFRRVIANTEADFTVACRWLELMGFSFVERVPQFGPDGRDHLFYVRGF